MVLHYRRFIQKHFSTLVFFSSLPSNADDFIAHACAVRGGVATRMPRFRHRRPLSRGRRCQMRYTTPSPYDACRCYGASPPSPAPLFMRYFPFRCHDVRSRRANLHNFCVRLFISPPNAHLMLTCLLYFLPLLCLLISFQH